MSNKVYECHNKSCVLGATKEPGRFTGGISAQQKYMMTGNPIENMKEGTDYGDGFCPNCGEKGKATGETHVSAVGSDEYDKLHQDANAQVEPAIRKLNDEYKAGNITHEELVEAVATHSWKAQEYVEQGVKNG